MVSIPVCRSGDPGSIPGWVNYFSIKAEFRIEN